MAQRFKATDLKEMIRSIVREEIKDVVGRTINEVLSERYLRQLAESINVRARGVGDTLHTQGDDSAYEPPPTPLDNDDSRWPFQKHPMKHDDYVESDNSEDQDRDREDPMSIFFEGTRSLKEIEDRAPSEDELQNQVASAPLPKNLNEQKRVWTALAGMKPKADESRVDPAEQAKYEEARIKRMRESLDVKA
jgi:hypothetical protein